MPRAGFYNIGLSAFLTAIAIPLCALEGRQTVRLAASGTRRNSVRSIAALPPDLAGQFAEPAGFAQLPSGDYLVFDRRGHTVFRVDPGFGAARPLVSIGSRTRAHSAALRIRSRPDGPAGARRCAGDDGAHPGVLDRRHASRRILAAPATRGARAIRRPHAERRLDAARDGASDRAAQPARDRLAHHRVPLQRTGGPHHRTPARHWSRGVAARPPGAEQRLSAADSVGRLLLRLPRRRAALSTLFSSRRAAIRSRNSGPRARSSDPGIADQLESRRHSADRTVPIVRSIVRSAAVDATGQLWVSFSVPYTYVYDDDGEKRRTIQLYGAGPLAPSSLSFAPDGRLLVTPGGYVFKP